MLFRVDNLRFIEYNENVSFAIKPSYNGRDTLVITRGKDDTVKLNIPHHVDNAQIKMDLAMDRYIDICDWQDTPKLVQHALK